MSSRRLSFDEARESLDDLLVGIETRQAVLLTYEIMAPYIMEHMLSSAHNIGHFNADILADYISTIKIE